MKANFLSHELRSPLNGLLDFRQLANFTFIGSHLFPVFALNPTGIQGACHILSLDPELPERLRPYLDIIEFSATHLHSVVSDLVDLGTLRLGGIRLTPVVSSLRSLVFEAAMAVHPLYDDLHLSSEPPLLPTLQLPRPLSNSMLRPSPSRKSVDSGSSSPLSVSPTLPGCPLPVPPPGDPCILATVAAGAYPTPIPSDEAGWTILPFPQCPLCSGRHHRVDIQIMIAESTPDRILCDPNRTRQVLTQILHNAVKFTIQGVITIRIQPAPTPEQPDLLSFEVSDTGIGMTAAQQRALFHEPLIQQPDQATLSNPSGVPFHPHTAELARRGIKQTGLGLTIAAGLVEAMGGVLTGQSAGPDCGSVFRFRIAGPVAPASPLCPSPVVDDDEQCYVSPTARCKGFVAGPSADPQPEPSTSSSPVPTVSTPVTASSDSEQFLSPSTPRLTALSSSVLPPPPSLRPLSPLETAVDSCPSPHRVSHHHSHRSRRRSSSSGDPAASRSRSQSQHAAAPEAVEGQCRSPSPSPPSNALRRSPTDPAPSPTTSRRAQRGALRPGRSAKHKQLQPHAVLVVDDDAVNRAVLGGILRHFGCLADFATDGTEAVEQCRQRRYPLIFMDIMMPQMDGLEATTRILANHRLSGSPLPAPFICALTAGMLTAGRERCFEVGMQEFLGKPIQLVRIKEHHLVPAPHWGTILSSGLHIRTPGLPFGSLPHTGATPFFFCLL
ncbi:putative Hpt sensor hybrid histidine kinase [Paratrimastix pyriformis]|uniref:histidine kinase n=1 Tax=Paratrimastix pyriformis TaxID=342808 RepID=A0ABQ8UUB7_9EUKA|nr:putative Hpt sensor hybrid histidine kinase [Paratrimastix pyriformis]